MFPCSLKLFIYYFFNNTATTEIYTLSLHDALPIFSPDDVPYLADAQANIFCRKVDTHRFRSEEHTSELQSRSDLVCRLLLEKKKFNKRNLLPAGDDLRLDLFPFLGHCFYILRTELH